MLITKNNLILGIILISLVLFSTSIAAKTESGTLQETGRISAYAVEVEGDYIYILGDAVSNADDLPDGSVNLGGGMKDIWLAKLHTDGTPVFTVLIGGSDDDSAYSLTVSEGVAYILGETWSTDFPGAPGSAGENDAVLLALAPDGAQILWARRFGGSDQDSGRGITLQDGSLYITGITWSQDMVLGNAKGGADGFLARVQLDGRVDWLKIFGGNALDAPYDLTFSEEDVWVVGQSLSRDFGGTHQGEGDAFAARFSPTGEFEFAKLLGGREADIAFAVSSDEGGVLLAGGTRSGTLPDPIGEFGGDYDGFFMRIDAGGEMQAVSYLGGTGIDYAHDIERLANGDVLVVGETYSPTFPLGYNTAQEAFGGGDAFIVHINPEGDVVSSWLKGGWEEDSARSMALTAQGLWLAGNFSLGELSYGLFVASSELNGIPFPNPDPVIPTATLRSTATPQPTETPRPTFTPTEPPLTATAVAIRTNTAAAESTATAGALETTPTHKSDVENLDATPEYSHTPEFTVTLRAPDAVNTDEAAQVDGPEPGAETGEMSLEGEVVVPQLEEEKTFPIITGITVISGLLLAAVLAGVYYWLRHKKISK